VIVLAYFGTAVLLLTLLLHAWRIADSLVLSATPGRILNLSSDVGAVMPALEKTIGTIDPSATVLIEAGAGFGHISRALAGKYRWKECIALDISYYSFVIAKALGILRPSPLRYTRADIHSYDFPDGALVYCYLSTAVLERLRPRLNGCLVASLTFSIPGETPTRTYSLKGWQEKLLIYDFR
jgi:hypothetical protein